MSDQVEQYEKSWILHHILDGFIGSREVVATRRKETLIYEQVCYINDTQRTKHFCTGSKCEGIIMHGSDIDFMSIDLNVIVICPLQDSSIPQDSNNKTVFRMSDAKSRPGYVMLELVQLGPRASSKLNQSIVPVRDKLFISSEMYRRVAADTYKSVLKSNIETHGPAACMKSADSHLTVDFDIAYSFVCQQWPRQANEWVNRPRYHGWPDKALRDQIVQGGCYLVPVGDRTSADPFLQWRISFATAERMLIYSLTHTQFLLYGLLKYFLKQISDRLKQIFGDEDIISSYIIKTVVLYAVEFTPDSLWQEKNTFFCFMFCLSILIAWVKAGFCPNYFISKNNMFKGKLQGENQQNLLHILIELHNMKWECLSVGTAIQPHLGIRLQLVRDGHWELVLRPPAESEAQCDSVIIGTACICPIVSESIVSSLSLLSKSKSDIDEFLGVITTVRSLCCIGMDSFEKHVPVQGNKEKYKCLRKSKNQMAPLSSVCTSPGLLTLATYYYQTGNYPKALAMCGDMLSSFKLYFGESSSKSECVRRYEHLYCGRGYTLLHKCKEGCVSNVKFPNTAFQLCPSQFQLELLEVPPGVSLKIPPLPYAVFLTFLCYHELGDTRRRDAALIHLRAVKYDEEQGVSYHWIVHNLLGICYEMVGDTHRALREYRDSLDVRELRQFLNPARRRIERLQTTTRTTSVLIPGQ